MRISDWSSDVCSSDLISGLVLVLRMPDIIRLRTSMETTSAIYSKRNSLRPRDNNILLLRRSNADRAVDVWLHCAGDEFDNRNDDRIPDRKSTRLNSSH